MSTLRETMEQLLHGDRELYGLLCEAGFLPRDDSQLASEHLETARVARTIVHELEVNWAGAEIILRMRSQLIETHQQVAELAEIIRQAQSKQDKQR
jgi:hypothetical protein